MKRFFISLLSCALLVPANAQQSTSSQEQKNPEDVVRITTNLVQVDASVTDKQGHPVTDLQKDDFEVYEDGRLQPITNFSFVSTGSAAATGERQHGPAAGYEGQHLGMGIAQRKGVNPIPRSDLFSQGQCRRRLETADGFHTGRWTL